MPLPPASLLYAVSALAMLLSMALGFALASGPEGILGEAVGLAFFGMFSVSMASLLLGIMLTI